MYENKTAEEILAEAEEQARRFAEENGYNYYNCLAGILRVKVETLCQDRDRGEVIHDEA